MVSFVLAGTGTFLFPPGGGGAMGGYWHCHARYAVLCYAMLCHSVLCHAMLCHAMP